MGPKLPPNSLYVSRSAVTPSSSNVSKMAPDAQDFSTLEAVSPNDKYFREQKYLPTIDLGKQVIPENGKYVAAYHDGLEASQNQELLSAQQQFSLKETVPEKRKFGRWKWFLAGGAVLLVVVLAAVVGGVVGSRRSAAASASNSTAGSNNLVLQRQRSIAAVSFEADGGNETRVYFQDGNGDIIERINAAVNTPLTTTSLGYNGTNRSSLAAAVSRPGFPLVSIHRLFKTCLTASRKSASSIPTNST
jgi:hypothetical protein